MSAYVEQIIRKLEENGNQENAFHMKKYMKDKFDFYGIKTPQRIMITKEIIGEYGLPDISELEGLIKELWNQKKRECHYLAIDLLAYRVAEISSDSMTLIEYMIMNHAWWDTVDAITQKIVAKIFLQDSGLKEKYADKWIESENIWFNRVAILYQLKYKKETDKGLLYRYIKRHSSSDEFFIQKAIGWILREYSKTDKSSVMEFLAKNKLSSLSIREASKYL